MTDCGIYLQRCVHYFETRPLNLSRHTCTIDVIVTNAVAQANGLTPTARDPYSRKFCAMTWRAARFLREVIAVSNGQFSNDRSYNENKRQSNKVYVKRLMPRSHNDEDFMWCLPVYILLPGTNVGLLFGIWQIVVGHRAILRASWHKYWHISDLSLA